MFGIRWLRGGSCLREGHRLQCGTPDYVLV